MTCGGGVERWTPSKSCWAAFAIQDVCEIVSGQDIYERERILFGNDTRKLRPKYLNKYTSLFLTACIEKQRIKYGYGYKMGTGRLKKQKILLPVDANNQPDWINIERFMQQMELEKIICYLKSKN